MDGGTTTNIITTILADVPDVFSAAVNMVVQNPVGAVFVGFAVIGAGITAFRKIRH